ncbi:MAG: type I-C CRISPR-associated protein Cas8c/Csd1, partial [Thermomicrobiales bacterium]
MLLQQLVSYAGTLEGDLPSGYQVKPVRYVIVLDKDGKSSGIADTREGPKDRGKSVPVPHAKRANAIRPQLFADNAAYTFGIVREQDRPERVKELHTAYRELVQECADTTGDVGARAVAVFMATLPESAPPLEADFDPSAWLTFEVDGVRVTDTPSVRRFWSAKMGGDSETEGGAAEPLYHCIVCNQLKPA